MLVYRSPWIISPERSQRTSPRRSPSDCLLTIHFNDTQF